MLIIRRGVADAFIYSNVVVSPFVEILVHSGESEDNFAEAVPPNVTSLEIPTPHNSNNNNIVTNNEYLHIWLA